MKAFRILFRGIRDSFRSVFRNFSLSVASIACTTITLILVSIASILSYNVKNITNSIERELTIVTYLEKDVDIERANEIQKEIEKITNVEKVSFKSKDEWKEEMSASSKTLETTLGYLQENPLLDSFEIKVKDVTSLKSTNEKILKLEGIKTSEYGEGMVEKIISSLDMVKKITFGIVIGLVLVTLFLISNTIKLTIFSRRNEIEIMRLVGTSNFAIKSPFVFEGLIIGFIGSIIPIILTIYGYIILYTKLGGHILSAALDLVSPFNFVFMISTGLLILGCFVGMFASFRAVRKYLKI